MSLRDGIFAVTQERMRQRLERQTYTATCAALRRRSSNSFQAKRETDLFTCSECFAKMKEEG